MTGLEPGEAMAPVNLNLKRSKTDDARHAGRDGWRRRPARQSIARRVCSRRAVRTWVESRQRKQLHPHERHITYRRQSTAKHKSYGWTWERRLSSAFLRLPDPDTPARRGRAKYRA